MFKKIFLQLTKLLFNLNTFTLYLFTALKNVLTQLKNNIYTLYLL